MTLNRALIVGAIVMGLAFSPGALQAQQVGMIDRQATDVDRDPEDNWLKVCDELDDGRQACIMRQVITTSGVFTGSFMLRDDPSQESRLLAVAAVPLGMLLPFGLTWQIDSGEPVRVPYMVCDPQSCAAQLVINEAYVQSLMRGGTLRLTAKNRRNEDIHIDIDLHGFTAVYESDDAMTVDELNEAQAPSSELDQVLQDRAEEMRQQLSNGEAAPNGAEAEGAPAEEDTSPTP